MRALRIALINLLILAALAVLAEIGFRVADGARDCLRGDCRFAKLTTLRAELKQPDLGLMQFEPDLGYTPVPGFHATVDLGEWTNATVSVDENGFRGNGSLIPPTNDKVLAVGDSFTFGLGVGDRETWPACVERTLRRSVLNAGVIGYSAGQSYLRARSVVDAREDISSVIYSVLVGHDVDRDTMPFRLGYPKPFLVLGDGGYGWGHPKNPHRRGTKENPRTWHPLQYSFL